MLQVIFQSHLQFARNKDILMCFQSPQITIDQGSNMSANVLLNELGKVIKGQACQQNVLSETILQLLN